MVVFQEAVVSYCCIDLAQIDLEQVILASGVCAAGHLPLYRSITRIRSGRGTKVEGNGGSGLRHHGESEHRPHCARFGCDDESNYGVVVMVVKTWLSESWSAPWARGILALALAGGSPQKMLPSLITPAPARLKSWSLQYYLVLLLVRGGLEAVMQHLAAGSGRCPRVAD